MTKRYTGGVVSSSLPTVNSAGASGVFLLSQQADYQSRNSWPPFKVEESLRFRSSAEAHLRRTPSAEGNRRTWTWSGWIKRGNASSSEFTFFSAGNSASDFTALVWNNNNLFFQNYTSDAQVTATTTAVFRDPAAWYHVVLAIDTTQSTAANRAKIYVNGVEQAGFNGTNFTLNQQFWINFTYGHTISARQLNTVDSYTDQYMAEINFVDGQALTPSSFGATDKDGNWSPIAYTGTYGTNGFYVNFRDNTSATTMGYDYSGNGNNWTLSGLNVSTANTTYDIMIDVPEDQDSANVRGNYCTLNSVSRLASGSITNGGLTFTSGAADAICVGTFGVSSGKWYWEVTATNVNASLSAIGIIGQPPASLTVDLRTASNGYAYISNGNKGNNNTPAAYGATYVSGDVLGVALDMDAGTLVFYKNNSSQGTAYSSLTGTFTPAISDLAGASSGAIFNANFGQRPFAYAPPTGFKSLNTYNLPEPTIKQPNRQFDASLWTGNGSTQSITGLNFKPDLVWVKVRSSTQNHSFNDPLRGAGNYLVPNATAAERFQGEFTSFNSNGFSLTYNAAEGDYNFSGKTYVGWSWNAGGANTTNTSGSITSIVRANPTAGFSIATYTGNGSAGATVGHGLGTTPAMIIVKNRSGVNSWIVQHQSLTGITYNLYLNGTDSQQSDGQFTAKSDTTVTLRSGGSVNTNGSNYVMYCFAPIAGYSAFGSYAGNSSSDGPFIFTGFRPRFVMIKRIDSTGNWIMFDSARGTYNINGPYVYANSSAVEATSSSIGLDFLSNGFKNINSYNDSNTSGGTYIYAAFAEAPFKYARSR